MTTKAPPITERKAAHTPDEHPAAADSKDSQTKRPPRPRTPGLSRDKILMVATRMFADEGFAATSVRDIASECGITLPSIYHFFGDKETLYNHCVAASFSAASERMATALGAGTNPKERVQQAIVAMCDMLLNNESLRKLLQRAMLRRDYKDLDGGMVDYVPAQFTQVTEDIRKLNCTDAPEEKAFAMYALALGVVQYRPVAERIGLDARLYSTPVHLAEYVLQTVLPQLR